MRINYICPNCDRDTALLFDSKMVWWDADNWTWVVSEAPDTKDAWCDVCFETVVPKIIKVPAA
jgi:hypothetical protein